MNACALSVIQALLPPGLSRGSRAYARLLAVMIPDLPPADAMIFECRHAIGACDNWEDLVVEMLTNLPSTQSVTRVAMSVLADKLPEHPAARWQIARVVDRYKAYDALDDGKLVRLDVRVAPEQELGECWLLSTEDPARSWAACKIERRSANTLWLDPERSSPLFREARYVLPPAMLLITRD